jgi:hypothetical protein
MVVVQRVILSDLDIGAELVRVFVECELEESEGSGSAQASIRSDATRQMLASNRMNRCRACRTVPAADWCRSPPSLRVVPFSSTAAA